MGNGTHLSRPPFPARTCTTILARSTSLVSRLTLSDSRKPYEEISVSVFRERRTGRRGLIAHEVVWRLCVHAESNSVRVASQRSRRGENFGRTPFKP